MLHIVRSNFLPRFLSTFAPNGLCQPCLSTTLGVTEQLSATLSRLVEAGKTWLRRRLRKPAGVQASPELSHDSRDA